MDVLGGSAFFVLVYMGLAKLLNKKPGLFILTMGIIAFASALAVISENFGENISHFLDGAVIGAVLYIVGVLVIPKK